MLKEENEEENEEGEEEREEEEVDDGEDAPEVKEEAVAVAERGTYVFCAGTNVLNEPPGLYVENCEAEVQAEEGEEEEGDGAEDELAVGVLCMPGFESKPEDVYDVFVLVFGVVSVFVFGVVLEED